MTFYLYSPYSQITVCHITQFCVKQNIIKINVLSALIRVNILLHNWRSMNWWIIVSNGRVSEEKYYISGSPAAIIVHGQQPPRSWSTIKIGCHYSPQSFSTVAFRFHHHLCNKIWWSIVSNAALRSNRMRTDTNPWSEAIRRSLVTLARAVSVLWLALNPDWKSS